MLDPYWVFVGAGLGLLGSLWYAYRTVRGSVRPNLVTWSLWTAAPLIAFFAQLDSGVGLAAVMTLTGGVGPGIVLIASLASRHFFARFRVLDLMCAIMSAIALAVWIGLGAAPTAVFVAVAADAIAALPTVAKAWRHPDSENQGFYVIASIGSVLVIATITDWNAETLAFVAYQLVLCAIVAVIIPSRRRVFRRRRGPGSPQAAV